eukprot:g5450.t1
MAFSASRAALRTEDAAARIRDLIDSKEGAMGVRLGVRTRGCNGLSYTLNYAFDDETGKLDEVVEAHGVRIVIDGKALFHVIGTTMDWEETALSAEFVFDNPNAKGMCGARFIPAGGKVSVNCRGGGEWRTKQKAVKAPRMGGRGPSYAPIELVSRKKAQSVIKRQEADRTRRDVWNPGRSKALSTEAEKARLQAVFSWQGGKALPAEMLPGKAQLPGERAGEPPPGVAVPGPRGERRGTDEQLFDEIMGEIEERKKFLDSMRTMGRAAPHEARVQAEIQQRVRELERLHKAISSVDAGGDAPGDE